VDVACLEIDGESPQKTGATYGGVEKREYSKNRQVDMEEDGALSFRRLVKAGKKVSDKGSPPGKSLHATKRVKRFSGKKRKGYENWEPI